MWKCLFGASGGSFVSAFCQRVKGVDGVELISLLTGQPAAVALAILAMYWLNRNTLEFAREKREMLEIIRAERKEWLDQARADRAELTSLQRASIETDVQVKNELNALRSQLAPLVANLQYLVAKLGGDAPRGIERGN